MVGIVIRRTRENRIDAFTYSPCKEVILIRIVVPVFDGLLDNLMGLGMIDGLVAYILPVVAVRLGGVCGVGCISNDVVVKYYGACQSGGIVSLSCCCSSCYNERSGMGWW